MAARASASEITARVLDDHRGALASTGAVITEAMHFVTASPEGAFALSQLVERSGMRIYDLCQPAELREAVRLMGQYRDVPMDFADATLLLLAEALDVHEIVTLDRRGFAAYRTRPGRGFRLVLEQG